MMLSDEQIERYSRQILLPRIGAEGQRTLLCAHARLSGSSAVTTIAGAYLQAAGVRVALEAGAPISAENVAVARIATGTDGVSASAASCQVAATFTMARAIAAVSGDGCWRCALPPAEATADASAGDVLEPAAAGVAGALQAYLAVGALLGETDRAQRWVFDLERGTVERQALAEPPSCSHARVEVRS